MTFSGHQALKGLMKFRKEQCFLCAELKEEYFSQQHSNQKKCIYDFIRLTATSLIFQNVKSNKALYRPMCSRFKVIL